MHSFVFTCFLLLQGVCLFSSIPVSTLKAGLPTLKAKGRCSCTKFISAAKTGELDIVKECMKKGFYGNKYNRGFFKKDQYVDAKDARGYTALIWASSKGKLPVVEYLLDKRANKDQINRYGQTALMKASKYGHFEVVEYLVDKGGAEVDRQDKRGKTALMWGSKNGHFNVVKYLAQKGADITIKDKYGKTAENLASGEVKEKWSSEVADL